MNELLRLSLVVNTNHSQFMDNLVSVILYALNIKKDSYNGLTIYEIRKIIIDNTCLDFSESEIAQAINIGIKANKVDKIGNERYSLGSEGGRYINSDNEESFEKIIKEYIEINKITNYNEEQIFKLISKYIYNCLNENIELVMKLLKREKLAVQNDHPNNQSNYSEEDKKVINDFLDWDNKDKNEMVYRLISFSVDYCRMTVKQNINSFKSFFSGKKFYLDANIIYRLMGINNQDRQSTVIEFITKCKKIGIQLVYSNFTKQEIFESFTYNVDKLKYVLRDLKASPEKVNELFEGSENFVFYKIYHRWAVHNNKFKDFDGFKSYLKTSFFEYVSNYDLKQEDFENFTIIASDNFENYVKSLAEYKTINDNDPRIETVKSDIQNVLNVRKLRERSKDGTAWNINQFIISADHYLINWSNIAFVGETSYVVLPSVWYSLILKVCGRTEDDSKSFIEFMKIRYNNDNTSVNLRAILVSISEITNSSVLQDKIIDELIQDNLRSIHELDETIIPQLVERAYDNVLEKSNEDGYKTGLDIGIEKGKEYGRSSGINEGKELGLEIGLKIGKIQSKIEGLKENSEIDAKNKFNKNKNISRAMFSTMFVVWMIIVYIIYNCDSELIQKIGIYINLFTLIFPTSILGLIKRKFLCTDINFLVNKENEKIQKELEELEIEMQTLKNNLSVSKSTT